MGGAQDGRPRQFIKRPDGPLSPVKRELIEEIAFDLIDPDITDSDIVSDFNGNSRVIGGRIAGLSRLWAELLVCRRYLPCLTPV